MAENNETNTTKFRNETQDTMRVKYEEKIKPKRSNSQFSDYQQVFKLDPKCKKRSNSLPTTFRDRQKNFSGQEYNKWAPLYYGCSNSINDHQVFSPSSRILDPYYLSSNENVDISLYEDNLSITSHVENSVTISGIDYVPEQLLLFQENSLNDAYNTTKLDQSNTPFFQETFNMNILAMPQYPIFCLNEDVCYINVTTNFDNNGNLTS
ncbi:13392_t:CDS:2 [Gigaspora margarita]|uniref:13392_t:CDS:1 n=1 Tax=Gigaspora margarita TaxID=4874 RepID=A0ABN7V0V4_GIGMA|nr:13392_t:CDS:2 [Gigaspora margarita]